MFLTVVQFSDTRIRTECGASLIEVLVAIVLLSFGMLAMGGLQSYAVAAGTMSANRGVASLLAQDLAERLRANPAGQANYALNSYLPSSSATPLSDVTAARTNCSYPTCSAANLAALDIAELKFLVRKSLPSGAVYVTNDDALNTNIWILWLEPALFTQRIGSGGGSVLAEAKSDNCPSTVAALDPLPRCYYIKVRL